MREMPVGKEQFGEMGESGSLSYRVMSWIWVMVRRFLIAHIQETTTYFAIRAVRHWTATGNVGIGAHAPPRCEHGLSRP
jgi:hypothetical protein